MKKLANVGRISSANKIIIHINYQYIQNVIGFNLYKIESVTSNMNEATITSEFSINWRWPLLKYLEMRRKPFFLSSCYIIGKKMVKELNLDDLASVAFSEEQRPIYYMRLCDFKDAITESYEEFASILHGSAVIVIEGTEERPTDDTLLVTKILDINSGV